MRRGRDGEELVEKEGRENEERERGWKGGGVCVGEGGGEGRIRDGERERLFMGEG